MPCKNDPTSRASLAPFAPTTPQSRCCANCPSGQNAGYRSTLGAAWMNRGHALLLQGDVKSAAAAVQAQGRSHHLVGQPALRRKPILPPLNFSGAWMNRANALLGGTDAGRFELARAAASKTMALVAPSERTRARVRRNGFGRPAASCARPSANSWSPTPQGATPPWPVRPAISSTKA